MYHEAMRDRPRKSVRRLAVASVALALGCGVPDWTEVRWPSARPGLPEQPRSREIAAGLALSVTRLDYGPLGVELDLTIENQGSEALRVELAAILLAVDGLEYAPRGTDPGATAISPGEVSAFTLDYRLGRTLGAPGAELVLRGLSRGGRAIVELPRLTLPARPVVDDEPRRGSPRGP